MATISRIVPTAPLHGVDLSAKGALPHQAPAPVTIVPGSRLDGRGVLASEKEAAATVGGWRDVAAYQVPPRLDRHRTDLAAERTRLADEAVEIMTSLQRSLAGAGSPDRGFQRKTLYATTTAEFRVPENLPLELRAGPFSRGASYRAIVRFSSAASTIQADTVKDQRAVGIRITDDIGRVQDVTLTSGAAGNHARGAAQFNSSMISAGQMARGGIIAKLRGLLGLLRREGLSETRRLAKARKAAVAADVSLAAMAFYSRSPIELGRKLVHLALLPVDGAVAELVHEARGARDGLGRDLCQRRRAGDVRYRVAAAEAPGLADMSEAPRGPWITIAELILPRQNASEAEMLRVAGLVHGQLAMHPFNVWEEGALTPRGELNEILRLPVYRASARNGGRRDDPPATPQHGA